jgi:hypothetical protein
VAAFAQYKFPRGFRLDEERLRKLANIVGARLQGANSRAVVYRVYRTDAYYYDTSDMEQVLAEDNAGWKGISRLDLRTSRECLTKLLLTFSTEGISLEIRGDDRDRVFLLLSDLRQYIEEEVELRFQVSEHAGLLGSLLLFMIGFVLTMATWTYAWSPRVIDRTLVKRLIESPDVKAKVNYLLEQGYLREGFNPRWWMLSGGILIMIGFCLFAFDGPQAISRAILRPNVFLFGAAKKRFEQAQRLRSNLFWGVGAAFIVSSLAGCLVWWLTSR